ESEGCSPIHEDNGRANRRERRLHRDFAPDLLRVVRIDQGPERAERGAEAVVVAEGPRGRNPSGRPDRAVQKAAPAQSRFDERLGYYRIASWCSGRPSGISVRDWFRRKI